MMVILNGVRWYLIVLKKHLENLNIFQPLNAEEISVKHFWDWFFFFMELLLWCSRIDSLLGVLGQGLIPCLAHGVKDPALLQLWLRSRLGSDPWPGSSIMLWCGQKKKKKFNFSLQFPFNLKSPLQSWQISKCTIDLILVFPAYLKLHNYFYCSSKVPRLFFKSKIISAKV